MKALFRKELRQLVPWAGLMLLVLAATIASVLIKEFHGWRRFTIFTDSVLSVMIFGSCTAALILGFLQTVLEIRRDQWAFLMHRGLSGTQIYLAKVGAGLSVYAVITLVSAAIAVVWCSWGGVEQYPFSWYQTLPMLSATLAAVGLYFAAMIAVVWKGPWYVSRVLPFVPAVLLVGSVAGFSGGTTEYVPPGIFLIIALVVGTLAIAAWGAFVRSGEAFGRPQRATICLGAPAFVALFTVGLGPYLVMTGLCVWLIEGVFLYSPYQNQSYAEHVVNQDGHVFRIAHNAGHIDEQGKWRSRVVGLFDLDDPESKRFTGLVGKEFVEAYQFEEAPEWKPLRTSSVSPPGDGLMERFLERRASTRVLNHLGAVPLEDASPDGTRGERIAIDPSGVLRGGPTLTLCFSSVDRWIYVYLDDQERQDGLAFRNVPRLISVIGPDGVVDSSQRPGEKFGGFLDDVGTRYKASGSGDRKFFSSEKWGNSIGIHSRPVGRFVFLFEDGLYEFDMTQPAVRRTLQARDGRKIRSLIPTVDGIALVYDDVIDVHSVREIPFGTLTDHLESSKPPLDAKLDLPGDFLYSIPIPKEIGSFARFEFVRVRDQDLVVFRGVEDIRNSFLDRFVAMKLDGTVLRSHDVYEIDLPLDARSAMLYASAFFLPSGPLFAAAAWDAFVQFSDGTGPGILLVVLRESPAVTSLFLSLLFTTASLCAWSALRTSRRYGFDDRTRRRWVWIALLFGPAGLFTLWVLRDWPARVACPACSQRRPVDREACPHCGSLFTPPPTNGTEILATEANTLSQTVLV